MYLCTLAISVNIHRLPRMQNYIGSQQVTTQVDLRIIFAPYQSTSNVSQR